jgi:iron complex outermembrane recepter protein
MAHRTRYSLPAAGALFCGLMCCALLAFDGWDSSVRAETDRQGQGTDLTGTDLTEVPFEDLMNIKVISVSRKEESLVDSAAAVFVITQEDIRRSGVTNIPDALRMAPGLNVARIDASKWAVSSRGFNDRFARYMLVLVDGRSVYTPLFSGVFWDAQDTLLEDIDRIEVVRGPGATMWGANAVNGIINIITKNAVDTTGVLVSAGGGTRERGFGSLRYGTDLGASSSLRFFAKYFDRAGLDELATGRQGHNGWHSVRGGFRLDSEPSARDALTLQGEYFDERMQETYLNLPPSDSSFNYTTPASGGNLLARWNRNLDSTADLALQLSLDHSEVSFAVFDERRTTFDLDFQHRFQAGKFQEFVWGGGYRVSRDRLGFPTSTLSMSPASQTSNLFSAFLQDSVTLVPRRLHLTLGSKIEHNDYTGFELQPSARLLWNPAPGQSLWAAVSRAVRTPSRAEETLSYSLAGPPQVIDPQLPPVPTVLQLAGSTSLKAEELTAYEIGYRLKPTEDLSFDLAAFYNLYRRLIGQRTGEPVTDGSFPPQLISIPVGLANCAQAATYGAELAVDARLTHGWHTKLAYTYLKLEHVSADAGTSFPLDGEDPQHQLSLRSLMNLSKTVDLDLWLRYLGRIALLGVSDHLTLDARLAWRPVNGVELALVGQNLFHEQQLEFIPASSITTQSTTLGRSVYGKATWKF